MPPQAAKLLVPVLLAGQGRPHAAQAAPAAPREPPPRRRSPEGADERGLATAPIDRACPGDRERAPLASRSARCNLRTQALKD